MEGERHKWGEGEGIGDNIKKEKKESGAGEMRAR